MTIIYKILIWAGCMLASAILTVVLKHNGIVLGAIPSVIQFAVMMAVASFLCKKIDKNKD